MIDNNFVLATRSISGASSLSDGNTGLDVSENSFLKTFEMLSNKKINSKLPLCHPSTWRHSFGFSEHEGPLFVSDANHAKFPEQALLIKARLRKRFPILNCYWLKMLPSRLNKVSTTAINS